MKNSANDVLMNLDVFNVSKSAQHDTVRILYELELI